MVVLELLFELRQNLKQIADQADVSHFKDRRFGVFIDRHNRARIFDASEMLNSAGDGVSSMNRF